MFPAADHTEHPSHSLIPSHADGRASVTPIFYSAVFQGTNNSRKIVVRTSVRSITTVSFICSASRESSLFSQVHLLNSSSISKISPLRAALISLDDLQGSGRIIENDDQIPIIFCRSTLGNDLFLLSHLKHGPPSKEGSSNCPQAKQKKRLTKRRRIIPLLFVI